MSGYAWTLKMPEKTGMDTSVKVQEKAKDTSRSAQGARGEVVVNVRFQPNGLVNMINHKPEYLNSQEWFDRLSRAASTYYIALSGGRGAFSIPGDTFQLIWEANQA